MRTTPLDEEKLAMDIREQVKKNLEALLDMSSGHALPLNDMYYIYNMALKEAVETYEIVREELINGNTNQ